MISLPNRVIGHSLRLSARLAKPVVRALSTSPVSDLLKELRTVDTPSLCDADKVALAEDGGTGAHLGLKLMKGLRPFNNVESLATMAGVARTVQLDVPDDILPVFRGLHEAEEDEVLVVNSLNSSRGLAGELFCAEASRKGLAGIIVDGPVRDTMYLNKYPTVRYYASSVSPYAGNAQSPGTMQERVVCGGVVVKPGDIVVMDSDGVVVGNAESFRRVLPTAKSVLDVERKLGEGISSGTSLSSMSNLKEHLQRRLEGRPSALEFRV